MLEKIGKTITIATGIITIIAGILANFSNPIWPRFFITIAALWPAFLAASIAGALVILAKKVWAWKGQVWMKEEKLRLGAAFQIYATLLTIGAGASMGVLLSVSWDVVRIQIHKNTGRIDTQLSGDLFESAERAYLNANFDEAESHYREILSSYGTGYYARVSQYRLREIDGRLEHAAVFLGAAGEPYHRTFDLNRFHSLMESIRLHPGNKSAVRQAESSINSIQAGINVINELYDRCKAQDSLRTKEIFKSSGWVLFDSPERRLLEINGEPNYRQIRKTVMGFGRGELLEVAKKRWAIDKSENVLAWAAQFR